jgi:hypothetical protein
MRYAPVGHPRRRRHLHLALALGAGLLIASTGTAARADEITDANVDAMMSAAKTPADHEALAAFFTKKAESALASAQAHERMGASYTGKPHQNIVAHCKSLAAAYRKQAQDYTALAKEETRLAKGETTKSSHGKKGT